MPAVISERIINGKKIVEFSPTPKMQLFAYALSCDQRYVGQDPEWVLKEIGLGASLFDKWRSEFNPFFEEWLEGVVYSFRGNNLKKMLEFVGLQKAFAGDFHYWKAFALREKVIQPDQLNHGIIPATLGVYAQWDENQVSQHCNTLLDALRGNADPSLDSVPALEDSRGGPLAGEAARGGPEVHPRGTAEVPKEPLALDAGMGAD